MNHHRREPSFRLQGRGRSPSGPKIQAQRAVKPKSNLCFLHQLLATRYSPPDTRHQILATRYSPPDTRHQLLVTRHSGCATILLPRPANPVKKSKIPLIDSLPLTLRAAFSSLSPLRSDSVKKMLSEMKNLLFLKGDPLLSDLLKNLLPSTRSSLNINN
jgi:hypothetical protein